MVEGIRMKVNGWRLMVNGELWIELWLVDGWKSWRLIVKGLWSTIGWKPGIMAKT